MLEQSEYYWRIRLPRKNGGCELSDAPNYMAKGEIPEFIENPPEIPLIFEHVWQWFLTLNASRQADNLISFSDMKAYFDLTQSCPSRWDLSLLQALDHQFLQMRSEHNKS